MVHRSLFAVVGLSLCIASAFEGVAGAVTAKTPLVVRDAVDGVLAAFDDHPLVAIGDQHGLAQEGAFYARLVRDPRFAARVGNVVVEFGGAAHQDIIDRYVAGETVPYTELRKVWTDVVGWIPTVSGQMYPNFFASVRAANRDLPPDRRIHVWLGEPEIDWSKIKTSADLAPLIALRDAHPARLIDREILGRHKKALILYGPFHFVDPFRHDDLVTLGDQIRRNHPGALFVIAAYAGYIEPACSDAFERQASGWPVPALAAPISGTWVETALRRSGCSHVPGGVGPPGGPAPSADEKARVEDATSGAFSDALLYLGPARSLTSTPDEESLYLDEAYFREVSRRVQIMTGEPLRWTDSLDSNTQAVEPFKP